MRLSVSLALLVLELVGPSFGDFVKKPDPSVEYDYVVVGSGAGGGTVASRLAEYGHKVLLVDAGDDQGDKLAYQVPAFSLKASDYAPMSWDYFVNHYPDLEDQKKDSKMTWRTPYGEEYVGTDPPEGSTPLGIWYPRAGTLGGCTAHHAMITIYPHKSDWEYIETLTGDSSWNPDSMRDLFMRLERKEYGAWSLGHGYRGWLPTSLTSLAFVVMDTKLIAQVIAAGAALGDPFFRGLRTLGAVTGAILEDMNNESPGRDNDEKLYQIPISANNGRRSGSREFIMDVSGKRRNDGSRQYHLDVLLNTLATRIIFEEGYNGKPVARGIDYIQGQNLYSADPNASDAQGIAGTVKVKKEVIISAGAFNTPQLLKLSGIGPKSELDHFGIDVVRDLPGVGTNLQDRYETTVISETDEDFSLSGKCTWLSSYPDPCLQDWQSDGSLTDRGGYTSNGIPLAVTRHSSTAPNEITDLLITGAPAAFKGYYKGYSVDALAEANHWSWIILKAHSRNNAGTVTLRSKNPRDTPIINFNSFRSGVTENDAAEKDIQAVVDGMEWARSAIDLTPAIPRKFREIWPGDRVNGTEEMKEWVQNEAWGHHASCTCPIGADNDPMAVLDSRFRVRGVDNLRVVDASVFPKIPGTYIVLPTFMIGEKAADVIHDDAY